MGGFLSALLRFLAPIAVEHGGQMVRDRLKAGSAARKTPQLVEVDRIQQVADDVELLRGATADGFDDKEIPDLLEFLINGINNKEDEEELFRIYRKKRMINQ